ncbi:hypothetical protein BC936DRAFT_143752 [Jimgerdemannia flammicorona]|uniref:Uncharacterized protein n=1 Tax=Jimgerdemannia flammicorona TaxID=994334 RepID=A0A433DM83_9FUNG|nr:hypothetical protein BC936DRAFT_143752 [Jimgerdemannia flammicorona]
MANGNPWNLCRRQYLPQGARPDGELKPCDDERGNWLRLPDCQLQTLQGRRCPRCRRYHTNVPSPPPNRGSLRHLFSGAELGGSRLCAVTSTRWTTSNGHCGGAVRWRKPVYV